MTATPDVIILGAGIAGASLAAELSVRHRVVVIEIDDHPGRHATGRSAAMYIASYGNATVRALTRASAAFLERPPPGFVDVPLLSPRGCLFAADTEHLDRLDAMLAAPDSRRLKRLSVGEAIARVPILHRQWLAGAVAEEDAYDIDVAALHQAYLRVARSNGSELVLGAGETTLGRRDALWEVRSRAGIHAAPVLVNATGAWADIVAEQAGARTIGLQPMRRTAFTIPAPAGYDIRGWPAVIDADESFYFKPDAGQLLISPANEDPMLPCDAVPEELDIAIAVDRFERATSVHVTRPAHRWAGLRSFVADRTPVVGFDADVQGFFWLAAQGGYGIQTASAMARCAAALIDRTPLPADIRAEGVTAEALSPSRAGIFTHTEA